MKKFATADLCDNNKDKKIQVLSSDFTNYGGKKSFYGKIKTLRLDKSNWELINILKNEDGVNTVLVVDVNADFYGVVGDKLSLLAQDAGYEAIILNGYVRDTKETINFNIGLYALGTCPLRNFEKTEAVRDIDLSFGKVVFSQNSYIYADYDGIIICNEELI